MAGIFQPIMEGSSGSSAVQPVSPAPINTVNTTAAAIGAVGNLATQVFGIYEAGQEKERKVEQAKIVTQFTEDMGKINDAVDSGQIDPTVGRSRMRALYNKYAASNPLNSEQFLEVQKKYGESQMGKALMEGGEAYQQQQAIKQKALSDGFTNVDAWQDWQTKTQAWKMEDERRKEVLYRLSVEEKKASISASQSQAILNRKKQLEIEDAMHQNKGIRLDLSGRLGDAQQTLESIISGPGTVEQKIAAVQESSSKIKGDIAANYPRAEQGNLNMAMTQVDQIQKWAEDSITKGKVTTAAKNSLDVVRNNRALELIGDDQTLNMSVMSSVFGYGFSDLVTRAKGDVISKMINYVQPPKKDDGSTHIPPPVTKDVADPLADHVKTQVKAEDDPAFAIPKKDILQNQVVNVLRSSSLYGDVISSKEDISAASKLVYGAGYEALKQSGSFDIPDDVRDKYKALVYTNFKEAILDINNQYLDTAVQDRTYDYSGTSKVPEVSGTKSATTKVVNPVVENGVFKFVAADGASSSAAAKASELNRKLAPAINNLAKMVAVANGDPDLNKALKELAPRLFEEQAE